MAKTKKATPAPNKDSSTSYPIPFTLEAFQSDILETFFFYMRTIGWMAGPEAALRIVGAAPAPDVNLYELLSNDSRAADLGLTYNHIRRTPFADLLEHLYQYAYHGRVDASGELMEDESAYSWIAAIVVDAARGSVAYEWDVRDYEIMNCANNCLAVVELANARVMLEGKDAFSYLQGISPGAVVVGSLTIRQMALLAGMEEMSIRAAANPKRPIPLKTINDGGSTCIEPAVAKAWLQSKGRYVPIVRHWSEGDFDLTTRRFTNFIDFANALDARYNEVFNREKDQEGLRVQLNDLGIRLGNNVFGDYFLEVDEAQINDEAVMKGLAAALELPGDLFMLRVKQLLAHLQLAQLEKQLRELSEATPTVNS